MNHIYRHGDWLFEPVKGIATSAIEALKDSLGKAPSASFTFGVGEQTGHNHVAVATYITKMKWWRGADGGWYADIRESVTLTHPEHSLVKDLVIAPGLYRVKQALEYDHFQHAVRAVID